MTDTADGNDKLTPASPDELASALAYALTFDGRKRFRASSEHTSQITARHLVEQLRRAGYVVFKSPPGPSDLRTSDQYPRPRDGGTWK